jgi:7-cyano-7-deazaguanine synthase
MSKRGSAIVLLSGGIDSFACAHFLLVSGLSVRCLFIRFGQAAEQEEIRASQRVGSELGLHIEIGQVHLDRNFGAGEVPGRNALLAFTALPLLRGPGLVSLGIHAGVPYYDCSPKFAERLDVIIQECTNGAVKFYAPLINWSKGDIIEYCHSNRLNLAITYSCEEGASAPCGRCASCRDRMAHNVS